MRKQIILGLLTGAVVALLNVNVHAAITTSDMKYEMEKTAKTKLDEFTAVDLDGDKKNEAIGTYIDDKQNCHVLYCDQKGSVKEIKTIALNKNTSWSTIDIISQGKENHVLINTANETALGEYAVIIGMKDNSPQVLFSTFGAINRDDDDNLVYSKYDYHSIYGKEEGFYLGRSLRISYVALNNGEYKEIVAKRVADGLEAYDNGEEVSKAIMKEHGLDYLNCTVYERANGVVHISIEDNQSSKTDIQYYFYTGVKKGNKLDIKITEKSLDYGIVEPALLVDGAKEAVEKGYTMAAASSDGKAALLYESYAPTEDPGWVLPLKLLYNGKMTDLPYVWFIKYGMNDIDIECGDFDGDKEDEIVFVKCDQGGTGHLASDITVIENPGTKKATYNIFNVDYFDHEDMKKGTFKKNGVQITVSDPSETIKDVITEKPNNTKKLVSVINKKTNKEIGYLQMDNKECYPLKIYWPGKVNPKINIKNKTIVVTYQPVVDPGVLPDHYIDLSVTYKYSKDGKLEPTGVSGKQLSLE